MGRPSKRDGKIERALSSAFPSPLWGGGGVGGGATREVLEIFGESLPFDSPPHPTLSPQGGEGRLKAAPVLG